MGPALSKRCANWATATGNCWCGFRDDLDRFLVYKGSIAIDGISLTIASVNDGLVKVAIIPHTYEATNLAGRKPGDRVNIECDILAKHVARLLQHLTVGKDIVTRTPRRCGSAMEFFLYVRPEFEVQVLSDGEASSYGSRTQFPSSHSSVGRHCWAIKGVA